MDVDRISSLPDELINRIFTFLPIKSTVQTSMLSRRWKFLWTRSIFLDFRGLIARKYLQPDTERVISTPDEEDDFLYLVSMVLSRNTSPYFSDLFLDVGGIVNPNTIIHFQYINFCIASIGVRIISNLYLCLPNWYLMGAGAGVALETFPQNFFIGNSLVRLDLECIPLRIHAGVLLPHLTYISLSYVVLADDDTLRNLLQGSPILRELNISQERYDYAHVLYIYSPSLQIFTYSNSYSADATFGFPIILQTPNLRKLEFTDHLGTYISSPDSELPLLKSANIFTLLEPSHYRFVRMLSMCKQAAVLTVLLVNPHEEPAPWPPSESVIQALPLFENLTHLQLDVMDDPQWPVWLKFLNSSPRLEWFSIYKSQTFVFDWVEPEVPRCLSLTLESITFEGFQGSESEWLMIAYFLKEGKALTDLAIIPTNLDKDTDADTYEKLSKLPRASDCDIKILRGVFLR